MRRWKVVGADLWKVCHVAISDTEVRGLALGFQLWCPSGATVPCYGAFGAHCSCSWWRSAPEFYEFYVPPYIETLSRLRPRKARPFPLKAKLLLRRKWNHCPFPLMTAAVLFWALNLQTSSTRKWHRWQTPKHGGFKKVRLQQQIVQQTASPPRKLNWMNSSQDQRW